mmetsp:Transcript_22556/g.53245  ORF Transcript_22556/g.53245 Transcript_22556/m.53245 type:complete len:329 (-) Transcript_22556:600-1586(-)
MSCLLLRSERRRHSDGESTVSIDHGIKRVPSRNGCFSHDRLATSSQSTSNLNHHWINPYFLFLVPFDLEFTVAHSIFDTNRTAHSFSILDKRSIFSVVRVNHFLVGIHHGPISVDFVVHPDVSNLDTTRCGGAGNQIHSELFTGNVFFEQCVLSLSSVGSNVSHDLRCGRNCVFFVLANEDVLGTHTPRSFDDDRVLQFQSLNSTHYISAISLSKTSVLGHSQACVGNCHLHQTLVTTSTGKSQVVHDNESQKSSKNIGVIHSCLTARDNTQKSQVLLGLNGLQMGGAFDDIELGAHWRLVDLVDANFKESFCSRIVIEVLGTVIWFG